MPRIEKSYFLLPPLLAVFGAQILGAVFFKRIEKYFKLNVRNFLDALDGDVHKRALLFHAYDFLDKRTRFRLVVKAHHAGLKLL